jgi:hypothetical protein
LSPFYPGAGPKRGKIPNAAEPFDPTGATKAPSYFADQFISMYFQSIANSDTGLLVKATQGLEKLGYCFGKSGQTAINYEWHVCDGSLHSNGSIGRTTSNETSSKPTLKQEQESKPTLKQEQENSARKAAEAMKLLGFCGGYFDIRWVKRRGCI